MEYALDCRVGGLVFQCHNEVQEPVGDFFSLVWKKVKK